MQPSETTPSSSSSPAPSATPPPRIAVLIVHGVADQRPNDTATQFIDLMVASRPRDASYVAGDSQSLTLSVPPMSSELPFRFDADLPPVDDRATPKGKDRSVRKSFNQSIRSDFHAAGGDPAQDGDTDRGLAFTQYLLHKAHSNGSPLQHYETRKTRLFRSADASHRITEEIDVFEMYWADLSRLSGAVPKIITEAFTLIFRVSRLGRDAVDEASRRAASTEVRQRRWKALSWLQTAIDWSFTNILAQLFAQLLLAGLMLIAFGIIESFATPDSLRITGIVLAVTAIPALAYFWRPSSGQLISIGVLALGLFTAWQPFWGLGALVLAALTTILLLCLRAADDRFPFAYISGGTLWFGLVTAALARLIAEHQQGTTPVDPWSALMQGGLTVFELSLAMIKGWWVLMAAVFVLWLIFSAWLTLSAWRTDNYRRGGSAGTGRLAVLVPLATFLIVSMALWAGVSQALDIALKCHRYEPLVFSQSANIIPTSCIQFGRSLVDVGTRFAASGKEVFAVDFADQRFENSTQAFFFLVVLLALVMVYLLLLTLPSVLAEMKIATSTKPQDTRRLGRWLTWFYRYLDRVILALTVPGVIGIAFIGIVFFPGYEGQFNVLLAPFAMQSQLILQILVISATSALAVLSIFGGVISRVVPGLRGPLDAALDVDNYMREFPRLAIPRARIFARYTALLKLVRAGHYDRIVVVSHSQGTVISTELLRYLSSTTTQTVPEERSDRLKEMLNTNSVRILTMGCPLRQLYGARFPSLYQWVLKRDPMKPAERQPDGPSAEDIGVDVWANAFGSGDYVGRWLWSQPVDPPVRYHPLGDGLGRKLPEGREYTYDAFNPMPPSITSLKGLREYETCIGFAAHTHYFDAASTRAEVSIVAGLVDDLIAG